MSNVGYACALLCACFSGRESLAQAYIPDQVLRDWLNQQLPGSVDGAGLFDTNHPGISVIDSAQITVPGMGGPFNADGIQYLSALEYLRISNATDLIAMEFPASLRQFRCFVEGGSVVLGSMPTIMDKIDVSSGTPWNPATLYIESLPDTVEDLMLHGLTGISWDNSGYAEDVLVDAFQMSMDSIVLPPIDATTLRFFAIENAFVDCSAAAALEFYLDGSYPPAIEYPENVEVIHMNVYAVPPSPWPSTMEELSLGIPYAGGCLPAFPAGLLQLDPGLNEIECIPNWPSGLAPFFNGGLWTAQTATYCSVLNSECPGIFPGILGSAFMDLDGDSMHDNDEPGVPLTQAHLNPGGQLAGCDAVGDWWTGVPPGDYTISLSSAYPYISSVQPTQHAASVPNLGDTDVDNDFAVLVQPDVQDLRVWLTAGPARPGFSNLVHLYCRNYGTISMDADFTFEWDGDQNWQASSAPPTSTSGNSATWSFTDLPVGATEHIVVTLHTGATVPLGTGIQLLLTASPIANDATPTDNTAHFNDIVVGSYDPNDKLLSPSAISPNEVASGQTRIHYTIRFQNTGTFLAERVVILDTLPADLQWESFQFVASSHEQHWYITDGVLHVIHEDIMLPDSASDEAGSHGFFAFSILPASDLLDGETVTNIAHIVFDFNEPIITPPAILHVDIDAGVHPEADSSLPFIRPNPATDRIQVIGEFRLFATYQMIDQLGQEVQSGRIPADGWIDVQAQAPGLYVLECAGRSLRFVKE